MVEPGGRAVFGHGQIDTAIVIVISQRAAPLLAINHHAAFPAGDCRETAAAVAAQPESAPGIAAGRFGIRGKEVLTQENVLVTVAVKISDRDAKGWSELGVCGKGPCFEMISPVQEDHGG